MENVHYPGNEILGEIPGIPAVIFSAINGLLGYQRWSDGITGVPPVGHLSMKGVTVCRGFIAGSDLKIV